MNYGERFRQIRLGPEWATTKKPRLTQEVVAERLKYERAAPVSLIEKTARLPRPATILEHAEALECEVWDLLQGVMSDYDQLRCPTVEAVADLQAVLSAWPLLDVSTRRLLADTSRRIQALTETRPTAQPASTIHRKASRGDRRKKRA